VESWNKEVVTRKPHKCFGCAQEFPAGSKLNYCTTVDNGEFYHEYWCPVCEWVWGKYFGRDDDMVQLGEWDKCAENLAMRSAGKDVR